MIRYECPEADHQAWCNLLEAIQNVELEDNESDLMDWIEQTTEESNEVQ